MSAVNRRKKIVNEILNEDFLPDENQVIVRIEAGAGNNLHEAVAWAGGRAERFLVSMPRKLRNSYYVKRGHFALCSWIHEGDRVRAEIVAPLDEAAIGHVKRHGLWPEFFCQQSTPASADSDAAPSSIEELMDEVKSYAKDNLKSFQILEHEEMRIPEKLECYCSERGALLLKHHLLADAKSGQTHLFCLHPASALDLSTCGQVAGSKSLKAADRSQLDSLKADRVTVSFLSLKFHSAVSTKLWVESRVWDGSKASFPFLTPCQTAMVDSQDLRKLMERCCGHLREF